MNASKPRSGGLFVAKTFAKEQKPPSGGLFVAETFAKEQKPRSGGLFKGGAMATQLPATVSCYKKIFLTYLIYHHLRFIQQLITGYQDLVHSPWISRKINSI